MPLRRPLAAAPLVLLLLVVVASCLPGGKAPKVAPERTLRLESEAGRAVSPKPFAVVFGGPRGATVDPSEVSIVWNRPMRPLDLAGQESAPPATLTTKEGQVPKGSWRWMGTSALLFAPETQLPRATEFVVTVPAGTKALDGSILAAPYTFEFSTPPPKLVRIEPGEGEEHLRPKATFDLRFNQPVDPKEVERAAAVRVGEGDSASWPFRAAWPKTGVPTLVRITPSKPLPLDSRVDVVVDKSLHGMEGPLPLGEERAVTMATYGPLRVSGIECWRDTPHHKCEPSSYARVELTNAVACKELRAHLAIAPALPLRWASSCADGAPYASVTIPALLGPARSFTVTVSAGLKDVYGQTLARSVSLPIETDDEWPSAEIGLSGSVFEAGAATGPAVPPHVVPVGSTNLSSYELVTATLDEATLTDFLTREPSGRRDEWGDATRLPGAKTETVHPPSAPNRRTLKDVSLDALLAGTHQRGAAVIGLRAAGRGGGVWPDIRVVSVTDLGISAKLSRFGSVVWVSRLSDGQPVRGAVVAVRKRGAGEVFRASTDDDGLAMIPGDRYSPVGVDGSADEQAVIIARDGSDWAYRRVSEWMGSEVPTDLHGGLAPYGMLFTERGVYRPGETIQVKGLFREPLPRGTATPKDRSVEVLAYDGSGEKVWSDTLRLDAFGGFAAEVPMPAAAHLGTGEVRAELDGADGSTHGSASTTLLLAAYKPAEFKVTVDPGKTAYVRGERASFGVEGDYLFGAPMTGGGVRATVTRGPGRFVPPGAEDLVLDDDAFAWDEPAASPRAGELQSSEGTLGEKGTYGGSVALAMPGQRGAEVVTFEAEVTDITRQSLSGRASVLVHPGEFYVALKPLADEFLTKGATLHPEVAAIEPSGDKRAGVPVHVELVRRTWHSVLEATGESTGHYDSRPVDKTLASCDVTTGQELASCALVASEAGYVLLRAQAKDGRGNTVAASVGAYVLGDSADLAWLVSDASRVELVPDKKSYEVGETARVLVKSPFLEADALVTVERAGVYRKERVALRGATPTVAVPITEDFRPNAFVSVELVRGRTQAAARGPDVGVPAYRAGTVELRVNPEARRLKVSVLPARKDYGPGDTVEADVVVADRAGKPVRGAVTFYAVDEGVLMLTGYKTPDPIPVFTAPRPSAVFALESRSELARILLRQGEGVGRDKGEDGGGGGEAATVRQDFRSTAFFDPTLRTGGDGKAHVRFKLPDGLTTYRLMAVVAAEDDRFGFGEGQVVTSRKLMARPAMPRFLRAGDAIEAGVVLTSKKMPAVQVEVTLEAKGVTVAAAGKRVVSLPANGSVEVRWPIQAPSVGKALFAFTARAGLPGGGEAKDAVRIEREVEIPLSPEAVALYGETTETVGERLGDLGAMRSDVGGLDVRLASTALVGLGDGAEQLVEYPYGCTEQLTSRLVPLIPLRGLALDYGFALPRDLDAVIDETVAKIVENQQGDGSFGYWIDSPRGDDWVTAYALWGLGIADKSGHHVPDGVLDRATRYLHASLAQWDQSVVRSAGAAFVLDVLAEAGSPDAGYMDKLFEVRQKLPLFARALLAHAMTVGKMDPEEVKELLRDLDGHLRVTATGATVTENLGDDYAPLMDSEARTTAMVLRALVAAERGHALSGRLAKGLLGLRRGGSWRSTQETAWALLALDGYRKAEEKEPPSFEAAVFLGDAQIGTAPFHGRSTRAESFHVAAEALFQTRAAGSSLAFDVDGRGTLFYEARLRYAKKELPREGLDRGFFVRKVVRSVRPTALHDALGTVPGASQTSAKAGDLVLVDLFVVTPDPREQVVIDDPLPAGLEAVDASFETTARSLDVTDAAGEGDRDDTVSDDPDGDARANGLAYNFAWYHREIRDERVLTFVEHMPAGLYHYRYLARAATFGRFVVPPTRAECMYEPETFGRTAGSTFEVTGS